MKKLQSKYIAEHKKIIKTIEKWMEETGANAVIVTELAKELNIDTRTLNKRLEVLEISKYGHFNKNRHLFVKEAD